MSDLAFDADMGRLLTWQLASGNPLFIVCHGPASLLATRIHGESPFKDYNITCFTNEEEEGVGLASRVTWLLETDVQEKVGVNFSRGPGRADAGNPQVTPSRGGVGRGQVTCRVSHRRGAGGSRGVPEPSPA
ncbi:hypothetical protein [Streptomyces sp. NPDC056987]|uniref:hypothetical protein n=1 Tax=Streptomyces sp. NPDC056987 TaxID=3345988 RepID=UPI0036438108